MMKRTHALAAALLAFSALGAHAQGAGGGGGGGGPNVQDNSLGPQGQGPQPSQGLRFAGSSSSPWSTSYNQLTGFRSLKSRAQVRDELAAGRQALLAHEHLRSRG
jgi:hypothetical protein